ncbi:hypothetical protein MHIP_59920 [Mycolicibacterium hippocampi]|uniref:Uncharacterized protein n=1 Tax=Mycolicibacterium hippocampi TaxID=659824 RepID=A0A7I9ZXH1_9MYCO|nr:hypothetical protein MHIP_59920 [Mycolicibacterium hippocampi]
MEREAVAVTIDDGLLRRRPGVVVIGGRRGAPGREHDKGVYAPAWRLRLPTDAERAAAGFPKAMSGQPVPGSRAPQAKTTKA